jgi:hypothetical protein
MADWLTAPFGFLSNLLHAIGLALRMSPDLPGTLLAYPHLGWLALAVAFLAGVSLMVADSVILFANHVRPRRFVAGLILNGILYALGLIVYAAAVWLVATLLFRARQPLELVVAIFWIGSAPLVFGFLGMAGTLGDYPRWFLQGWSWLIVLVAVRVGFHLALWQAVACIVLSWLLVKQLKVVLEEPLGAVIDRLWRLVAGGNLGMSLRTQRELRSGQIERETVMRLSRSVGEQLAGLQRASEE